MIPKVPKHHTSFAYQCRIDSFAKEENPFRDKSWDIKRIIEHRTYKKNGVSLVKLKVQYLNHERTWENLQTVSHHDMTKVLEYALQAGTMYKPG